MNIPLLTREELLRRKAVIFDALAKSGKSYDTVLILSKINQYYLTGTMQDGILVLRRDGAMLYYVRKSIARAQMESPLAECLRAMTSYAQMREELPRELGDVYLETSQASVLTMSRLEKYFDMGALYPIDPLLSEIRAVKSEYELELTRRAGMLHCELMNEVVPSLLREGMSEAELMGRVYAEMMRMGHHGVSRFNIPQSDGTIGQIGFGENSLYPTNFDGPGGMRGMSAAVPGSGARDRVLKKGDLVFVDVSVGVEGYHSDKTQVYSFGAPPSDTAVEAHAACVGILRRAAGALCAGSRPSDIYDECTRDLPACLNGRFMGFHDPVKFLGHGVGLHINETPVIARGFDVPLCENMIIALEPKFGIEGVGMVGAEETYRVTRDGGECLTGGAREIIVV